MTRNSLHQLIDADGALICETCQLQRPYECFPECAECLVAVAVANGKWQVLKKLYTGASWFPRLEREHERQTGALAQWVA